MARQTEMQILHMANIAILVLQYAANDIDNTEDRGVFVKAWVEDEAWAVKQFRTWLEKRIKNEY